MRITKTKVLPANLLSLTKGTYPFEPSGIQIFLLTLGVFGLGGEGAAAFVTADVVDSNAKSFWAQGLQ